MNFYISDLHFGHANVILHDSRPFADVEEMDRAMIERWNEAVGDDDDVYVVGDFCYRSGRSPEWYLGQLAGRKHLVAGNHDWRTLRNEKALAMFASVSSMLEVEDGGRAVVLCHYPMAEWRNFMRGAWHVYGHIHNRRNGTYEFMRTLDRALNAGAPVNGYRPVPFDELVENNRRWGGRMAKTALSAFAAVACFAGQAAMACGGVEADTPSYLPCEDAPSRTHGSVATPEQRTWWDVGVAEAHGVFRGTPFRLRDGEAVVTAMSGRLFSADEDYLRDPLTGKADQERPWRLETHPQWCAHAGNRTFFVLKANALADDGGPASAEDAVEDTLLLYWRDDGEDPQKWECVFLGNRLTPLHDCANAVSIEGKWLFIETTWHSTEKDGRPVVYELEDVNGTPLASLFDRAASILHDCKWFLNAQETDGLRPGRRASPDCRRVSASFHAVWRHPLPKGALRDFILREKPPFSDCFHPIAALEDGLPETTLADEIGNPLSSIYAGRAGFKTVGWSVAENWKPDALAEKWRREGAPPLLTIRETTEYEVGGAVVEESVDYSFSRDGAWLVLEPGYLIPETETPDGIPLRRSRDFTILTVPDSRREEVRALLEKAAATSIMPQLVVP